MKYFMLKFAISGTGGISCLKIHPRHVMVYLKALIKQCKFVCLSDIELNEIGEMDNEIQ